MFHSKTIEREIFKNQTFVFSVILGTTGGQLIIMDHHGNTTEVCSLSTQIIKQLIYSCNKFYPEAPNNSKSFIRLIVIFINCFFRCNEIC
jgi:hypothetical protein